MIVCHHADCRHNRQRRCELLERGQPVTLNTLGQCEMRWPKQPTGDPPPGTGCDRCDEAARSACAACGAWVCAQHRFWHPAGAEAMPLCPECARTALGSPTLPRRDDYDDPDDPWRPSSS